MHVNIVIYLVVEIDAALARCVFGIGNHLKDMTSLKEDWARKSSRFSDKRACLFSRYFTKILMAKYLVQWRSNYHALVCKWSCSDLLQISLTRR